MIAPLHILTAALETCRVLATFMCTSTPTPITSWYECLELPLPTLFVPRSNTIWHTDRYIPRHPSRCLLITIGPHIVGGDLCGPFRTGIKLGQQL